MTNRASAEGLLSRDNPRSRWHAEQVTRDYHQSWSCIPLTDAVEAAGIDEDVLRQMVERPMTSAYFEDFNAGRLDSEQVARALAGDYAALSTPRTETSETNEERWARYDTERYPGESLSAQRTKTSK